MMRKIAFLAAGAVFGALVTGSVAQFGGGATAAATDTYRQLNLFGDVFERVRSDYVEKPNDSKLVESAINGMPMSWASRTVITLRECSIPKRSVEGP